MNIRQATVDDAQKMIDYLTAFWVDGCDTVFYRKSIPDLQQEREWLSERDGDKAILFVVEEDEKIIGSLGATIPKAIELCHTCEIGMTVIEQYRNQGIGRILIQHLLEWVEMRNIRIVGLNVFSINTPAISLYSDLGFSEDGRVAEGVELRSGNFCDLIHMSKHT